MSLELMEQTDRRSVLAHLELENFLAHASTSGEMISRSKARFGVDDQNENRLWIEGLMMHFDSPLQAMLTVPDNYFSNPELAYDPQTLIIQQMLDNGVQFKMLVPKEAGVNALQTMLLQPIDMRDTATGHEREKYYRTNGVRGAVVDAEIRNENELWVCFVFWMQDFIDEARFLVENLPYMGMSVDLSSDSATLSTDYPETLVFSDPRFYGGTILFRDLAADKTTYIGAVAADVFPYHDLPLADRDREWDSSAADGRVRKWAEATDAPNKKYAAAFLWHDSQHPDLFGSYKLPYADVIDGKLTAIPRGLFAAAQRLSQTKISNEDKDRTKSVLSRWYAKMRREFDDDSIRVPWGPASGHAEESPEEAHEENVIMEMEKVFAQFFETHKELFQASASSKDQVIEHLQKTLETAVENNREQLKNEVKRDLEAQFEQDKLTAVAEAVNPIKGDLETLKASLQEKSDLLAQAQEQVGELTEKLEQEGKRATEAEQKISAIEEATKRDKLVEERITVLAGVLEFASDELTDEFRSELATISDDRFENMRLSRKIKAIEAKAGESKKTEKPADDGDGTVNRLSAHAAFQGGETKGDVADLVSAFTKATVPTRPEKQ